MTAGCGTGYRGYLERGRGLTAVTIDGLERVATLFVVEFPEPLEEALWRLTAGDVTGFVIARSTSGRLGTGARRI